MEVVTANRQISNFRVGLALLFWPIVLGTCYYLTKQDAVFVEEEYKQWAIAHIILHCVPIYLYIVRRFRSTSFPFIEILAAFNVVHYGLPVFFIEPEDFQLGTLRPDSLIVSFTCYLIFYSTYFALLNSSFKVKGVEFAGNTRLKVLKYFGYLLLLCYLGSSVVRAIYHVGYVGLFVYIGIFINLWREKLLSAWEKFVFVGFVGVEFINRALGGLLSPFALLVLFIILCIIMSHSNKWLILLAAVLFIWFYSIFSNIKFEYRNAVWYEGKGGTFTDKIVLLTTLYNEQKLNKSVPIIHDYQGRNHFLWRFSYQSSAMSMVLDKTPSQVPYWNGDSYVALFSKFVPRFMWPNKPSENMGYRFGVAYGVIRSWNVTTSINTPILAELYMNFGYAGLYFGSVLLGCLYFLLVRWFNNASVTYTSKVIGMSIIFPLMIWESNFSLAFGNLILITLVFYFLFKILDRYVK